MTPEQQNNELLSFFSSSLVALGWFDKSADRATENGGNGRVFSVSGFVVSVQGVWFLITAGHILEDLANAKANGQALSGFHIDDCWAKNSPRHQPAGFDLENAVKAYFHDESSGADYAAIHLRDYYKSQLQANGVKAWDESVWKNAPVDFEKYLIAGFPDQLASSEGLTHGVRQTKAIAFFTLGKLAEAPEDLKKPFPRDYFEICQTLHDREGDRLQSLDGMSGCPIFGLKKVDGGRRIWITAIQSGEDKATRTIAFACRFDLMGIFLEDFVAHHPEWLPTP